MLKDEIAKIITNFRYAHAEAEDEQVVSAILSAVKEMVPEEKSKEEMLECRPKIIDGIDIMLKKHTKMAEIVGHNACRRQMLDKIEEER